MICFELMGEVGPADFLNLCTIACSDMDRGEVCFDPDLVYGRCWAQISACFPNSDEWTPPVISFG